tara:strand:- start:9914 stop:10636 length:723 start_codon:yes stop_codon:yes gene_type:complete
MKRVFFLVQVIFLISCINTYSEITDNIEAQELYSLLHKEEGLILDVRTLEEFNSGHIEGATNIDFYSNDFIDKLKLIRKDIPIYVYCRSGGRSSRAAIKMGQLGFRKIYNLLGGIKAWEKSEYPLYRTREMTSQKQEMPIFSTAKIDEILKNNNIVLLEFSTEWCLPCKKMKPIIQDIKTTNPTIKCIYINADRNKPLVENYKVEGIPTFIVFINNVEVFRHIGIISKNELLDHLLYSKK